MHFRQLHPYAYFLSFWDHIEAVSTFTIPTIKGDTSDSIVSLKPILILELFLFFKAITNYWALPKPTLHHRFCRHETSFLSEISYWCNINRKERNRIRTQVWIFCSLGIQVYLDALVFGQWHLDLSFGVTWINNTNNKLTCKDLVQRLDKYTMQFDLPPDWI